MILLGLMEKSPEWPGTFDFLRCFYFSGSSGVNRQISFLAQGFCFVDGTGDLEEDGGLTREFAGKFGLVPSALALAVVSPFRLHSGLRQCGGAYGAASFARLKPCA